MLWLLKLFKESRFMYKDIRYLSNLREIEYLKRKEAEDKREKAIFQITKFELTNWKGRGKSISNNPNISK